MCLCASGGFFNIERGINECGIESSVMFAKPVSLGGVPVKPATAAARDAAARDAPNVGA